MSLPEESFRLRAVWGGRLEPVTQIADRMARTLTALEELGGELGRHFIALGSGIDVTANPSKLSAIVRAGFEPSSTPGEMLWRGGSETTYLQAGATPRIDMSVSAGRDRRSLRSPANSFMLLFEQGATSTSYPVHEEVVPNLPVLFRSVVECWEPDAVLFDSPSLPDGLGSVRMPGRSRQPVTPGVGYATWLSDDVSPINDRTRDLRISRMGNGTFFAIDFGAPDVVAETVALIGSVLDGASLPPLPLMQLPRRE